MLAFCLFLIQATRNNYLAKAAEEQWDIIFRKINTLIKESWSNQPFFICAFVPVLWGWGHVPADILSEKFLYFFTWLVIIEGGNFSARLPVIHKTDEGHISGYKRNNLSTIEAFWNIIFQNSEPLVWQKEEKAKLEIIFQVTGTGIPHNVTLLCSTQTFSVFDEIQPNKLQYVNLNHHSERFDVMIEQIFIKFVWAGAFLN